MGAIEGLPSRVTQGLPERRFRPELHGLRGLAIMLVVLFHLFGQGRVSGGLDVFLVISGYLFTGMLLREAATTGTIAALPYLARLVRRLLPAMLTVVAATVALGYLVLPEGRRIALLREGAASVLYLENWELIHSQLAYEAAGSQTSVFQHIWSLSVQGQFYLLWPIVTVLAVLLARRLQIRASAVMIVVCVVVIAASFSFAVVMHQADQANAYLNTGTRLWQLAVGALVALLGSEVLPRSVRPLTGWVGAALIVSCGFVLDGAALFPGPWAWWPVLGFALIMWSEHPARYGVTQVLRLAPFGWVSDISYALYLWHWPLLVLWLARTGSEQVTVLEAVGIFAASIALAWLTLRMIERPTARGLSARPILTAGVGVSLIAVLASPLAVSAGVLQADQDRALARQAQLTEAAADDTVLGSKEQLVVMGNPGGRVLDPKSWVRAKVGAQRIPDLAILERDQPEYYDRPCRQEVQGLGSEKVLVCDDPAHPEGSPGWSSMPVVVITGGSHAGQWAPAFHELAQQHGWRVLVVVKSACQLTSNRGQYPRPRDVPTRASCVRWNDQVIDVIDDLDPELVVSLATTSLGDPESTSRGFLDQWRELRARDLELVVIRDTPRIRERLATCLSRRSDPKACATPRTGGVDWGLAEVSPFIALKKKPRGIGYIDLSDYYCPDDTCPAVIGNVIVYRDHSHLSATYARTLSAPLSRELRTLAPQLYE